MSEPKAPASDVDTEPHEQETTIELSGGENSVAVSQIMGSEPHNFPTSSSLNTSVPRRARNPGITCDQCWRKLSTRIRYKCETCDNYHLCAECCDNPPPSSVHDRTHFFLRIQPKNARETIHENTSCDGCDQFSIRGKRYKCKICEDFDLCERCMANPPANLKHPWFHRYICFPSPALDTVHEESCDGCGFEPIRGPRFRCIHPDCQIYPYFDLCSDCMELGNRHPSAHPMRRIPGEPSM